MIDYNNVLFSVFDAYNNSIFSATKANLPKSAAVYELKLDIIRNPERYEQGNIIEPAKNLSMNGAFSDKRVSNYLTAKEVEEVYDDTLEEIRGVE